MSDTNVVLCTAQPGKTAIRRRRTIVFILLLLGYGSWLRQTLCAVATRVLFVLLDRVVAILRVVIFRDINPRPHINVLLLRTPRAQVDSHGTLHVASRLGSKAVVVTNLDCTTLQKQRGRDQAESVKFVHNETPVKKQKALRDEVLTVKYSSMFYDKSQWLDCLFTKVFNLF